MSTDRRTTCGPPPRRPIYGRSTTLFPFRAINAGDEQVQLEPDDFKSNLIYLFLLKKNPTVKWLWEQSYYSDTHAQMGNTTSNSPHNFSIALPYYSSHDPEMYAAPQQHPLRPLSAITILATRNPTIYFINIYLSTIYLFSTLLNPTLQNNIILQISR